MALFLLSYILIYGAFHAYVFWKVRLAFAPPAAASTLLLLWAVAMIAAPILSRILERHAFYGSARLAAWIAYCWFGLVFLFLWTSLVLDAGTLLHRVALRTGLLPGGNPESLLSAGRHFFAALALSILLFLYGLFEAGAPRVERVRIPAHRLPPGRSVFRIVQVSDIHLGHIEGARRLEDIIARIRAEKPDMVVATGDIVDARMPEDREAALTALWRGLDPPEGKFAVTGNHEFYSGIRQATDFFHRAGFRLLRGETARVAEFLEVGGVDDPAGAFVGEGSRRDENTLFTDGDSRFRLLLKHQPLLAESPRRAHLQLSGHTHKGQIFPFDFIVRLFYPWASGLHETAPNERLYVSRGTGTWGPPIRVLARPEITVFELSATGE